MTDATVEFGVLCAMFEAIARSKKPAYKRKHIRTFLHHVYTGHEHFSAMRLILPDLDKERANYGLKEAALAKLLADALGLSKDSEDAKKLVNWRKGGQRAGSNAGNFSVVASEVLSARQKTVPGTLRISDVNDLLDRLAASQDNKEKTGVLAEFISKTNAQEMRWIIMILLKELKLGISEKTVFTVFHLDAEDHFNVTCDLKLVCEKLRDPSIRYMRQDIEVGKAVRPQLAARARNVEDAWRKMKGKDVVVECKFDGDRIQIHKNGNKLNFWSRSFIDHQEYIGAIGDVLCQHILPDKCILDGEMLVWDRNTNRFAEFGSNRSVAKGAMEGLDDGQQICYVAFDILYYGDGSVIHRPLRERQQLLQSAVRPLSRRLELLNPEAGGLNSKRAAGDSRWSILATTAEEVERFFQETIDNKGEGVILKDLDSIWEPSDRGTKWLKLKPDYIHAESDLDVIIIGCYYGSGRHGGKIFQFLLGLAERPKLGGHPTKWNEKGSTPPAFYVVTNIGQEPPDVWIDQPEKSVILQIASDIRTIRSEVFASPYSLRFPRVEKIRYDKPWYDCLDVQTLVDTVHAKVGENYQAGEGGAHRKGHAQRAKVEKPESKRTVVPSHLLLTDFSYIVNSKSEHPVDILHKQIVENGGSFSMNMSSIVTHAVALEKKGYKYLAAAKTGDVIHLSWLLDCVAQKALLPIGPKHYLHISAATKKKLESEVDEFGDFYFIDVDESDLTQMVKHFAKKFCPTPTWSHYAGCCVFFLRPFHSINEDTKTTLRRLALEVEMQEGTVSHKLTRKVTHIVAYTPSATPVAFQTILKSVGEERRRLLSKRVKVVSHRRIEDSVGSSSCSHPEADNYDLRVGESLESEEEIDAEDEEEIADKPIAKTASGTVIPITPDKRLAPRPPRKPVARRRALPIGGRGRGCRGSKREESPEDEEHDEAGAGKRRKTEEESPSKSPPKRRLIIDDNTEAAASHIAPPPAEPSRPRTSTRVARNRKIHESYVSEEPVAVSHPEEAQNADVNVRQETGDENQHSQAFEAMMTTLLPDYFSSQP